PGCSMPPMSKPPAANEPPAARRGHFRRSYNGWCCSPSFVTKSAIQRNAASQHLVCLAIMVTDKQRLVMGSGVPGDTRPIRLLCLLPFAPRLDATDGGSRVMARLLLGLAQAHRLAVLYLRAPDHPG